MIKATMNIRMVPLHEIKPYENNIKQHPVKQLESISHSIKSFGFKQPLVLDRNNVIVCGHARYEAAAALGIESVPCEIADELSEEQISAYRILDNEIAAQGYTDLIKLNVELGKLPDFDFKPFNIEFPKVETAIEGQCDPDDVPAITVNPKTRQGDVWILGNHRLMCGDSTSITDVEKLMNGEIAEMAYCDPQYGANIVNTNGKLGGDKPFGNIGNMTGKIVKAGQYAPIIGDETTQSAKDSFNLCDSLKIKNIIFWGAQYYAESLPPNSGWIVWDKETDGSLGDGELAYSNLKKAVRIFKHKWSGMIKASEHGQARVHPTQKPIALAEWCFENYGNPNVVLDLFGGSGSTLIACEKTNRKCIMMEISPAYCDIIVNRWQKFTGKDAILEYNGMSFNEVPNG